MCFLTDPNLLYIHALGLYDLELTLLVAQQAQKVSFPLNLRFLWTRLTVLRILANIFHSCGNSNSSLSFGGNSKSTTILDAGLGHWKAYMHFVQTMKSDHIPSNMTFTRTPLITTNTSPSSCETSLTSTLITFATSLITKMRVLVSFHRQNIWVN